MNVVPPPDVDAPAATREPPELCRACGSSRRLAFCAGLSRDEIRQLSSLRSGLNLPAGTPVFREGDPAEWVYSVSTGALKLYKLLSDGRRQIVCFLFPGDLFGLGSDDGYAYTAETLVPTQICRFSQRKLETFRGATPRLERRIFAMTLHDLLAAQEQMLLLGRKTAREKVASFVLDLSRRATLRGLPENPVTLPMSRADIADYLGLTIETVSRIFSHLKRAKLIELPDSSRVILLDLPQLEMLAEGLPS